MAYFVVSEALTNVARHSQAQRASVVVVRREDRLVVDVADDGVGGAVPSDGSGLVGLAARVMSLDGELTLQSPDGGPTTVRAVLPWR